MTREDFAAPLLKVRSMLPTDSVCEVFVDSGEHCVKVNGFVGKEPEPLGLRELDSCSGEEGAESSLRIDSINAEKSNCLGKVCAEGSCSDEGLALDPRKFILLVDKSALGRAVTIFIIIIVSMVVLVVPFFAARSSTASSSLLGRFLVS
jgi:hypothetical protein